MSAMYLVATISQPLFFWPPWNFLAAVESTASGSLYVTIRKCEYCSRIESGEFGPQTLSVDRETGTTEGMLTVL
eukprot:scaffold250972_cov38-Prasinocladus_malaysianus.AAC.1